MIPERSTPSICSTAISNRGEFTSMLWSLEGLRSLCSVLFLDSRKIATFCSRKHRRTLPRLHKVSHVKSARRVVRSWTNGSIMDRLPFRPSFGQDGRIGFRRHLMVRRSACARWVERTSYVQSYLLCATAALICWTASRLRQVGRHWTGSFSGWSNRTPVLGGQHTFA